jgi:hypothetical protein
LFDIGAQVGQNALDVLRHIVRLAQLDELRVADVRHLQEARGPLGLGHLFLEAL